MLNKSYKIIWRLGILGATSSGLLIYYQKKDQLFTQIDIKPLFCYGHMSNSDEALKNQKLSIDKLFIPPKRSDLPIIKIGELKKHDKNADRIWVNYKMGVYDVTDFIQSHPGGDKILLAAGGSVEPFWSIYAQHKTIEVMEILETLRIGTLDINDLNELSKEQKNINDPFNADPSRHPALIINSEKPFNAEVPPSLLVDNFQTPNELFFVRNHMPVPDIDEKNHKLTVEGIGIKNSIILSVENLKNNFEKVYVNSVVQCAGNRRNDMNNFKKVQGLMWTGTAISNAKWAGCRMRDVLIAAGVNPNDSKIKHIHFEGADIDSTGTKYGASISFQKAMSPETIIAYEMNDQPIPRDHGFPLRAICPGIVGARQVKWLTLIITSDEESSSHWQRKDYRAFSPSTNIGDKIDFNSAPSIQECPVQSAICLPAPNTCIEKDYNTIDVCGYAWSGGGRGIIRVEVSIDNGKTWQSAELEQDPEQDLENMWAWTLWRTEIKIPENLNEGEKFDIICKATDRAYNCQPETATGLWNVRGLLHNAWHRVPIKIVGTKV